MDAAVEEAGPYWSLLVARVTACALLGAALLALRPRLAFDRAALPSLALIGALDVAANAFFALGHRHRAAQRRLRARLALPGRDRDPRPRPAA